MMDQRLQQLVPYLPLRDLYGCPIHWCVHTHRSSTYIHGCMSVDSGIFISDCDKPDYYMYGASISLFECNKSPRVQRLCVVPDNTASIASAVNEMLIYMMDPSAGGPLV
jgi:hypothetical protein